MSTPDVMNKLIEVTGLSARGLARALKLPENAVCYYVAGKKKPCILSCYQIIKFAKKHDIVVTLEELYPDD